MNPAKAFQFTVNRRLQPDAESVDASPAVSRQLFPVQCTGICLYCYLGIRGKTKPVSYFVQKMLNPFLRYDRRRTSSNKMEDISVSSGSTVFSISLSNAFA